MKTTPFKFLFAKLSALLCALLCMAFSANASTVDSLLITVRLENDGSALVSEQWNIDVSGSITEWYRVIGNLGRMTVGNLRVHDETGKEYVSEGDSWDIDRSREEKAGRCGIVRKSGSNELCWGIGSSGRHEYHVSYALTGLVQEFEDADGFNFMFLAKGQSDPPRFVECRIFREGVPLDTSNARIWGFGFHGDINFNNGEIVATSSGPFSRESSLIVLAGFEKGVFSPAVQGKGTFESLREKAFKGSDYEENKKTGILSYIIPLLIGGLILYIIICNIIKDRKRRKQLLGGKVKDVPWFRDTPVKGDLRKAGGICKLILHDGEIHKKITDAYILRLFYKKAFSMTLDSKGNKAIRINDYEMPETQNGNAGMSDDLKAEFELYSIFKKAAGENGILEKKELKQWLGNHEKKINHWIKTAKSDDTLWSINEKDTKEVIGLNNFLKDFTLINEKGVEEVQLWNNYLIFAALFGIADKVYKEIKKICPDYDSLSGIFTESTGFDMTDVLIWSHYSSSHVEKAYYNALTSGTSGMGGGTSFSGGGGFSGGGFGGGGR